MNGRALEYMVHLSRFAATEMIRHGLWIYAYIIGDDGHIANRVYVLCPRSSVSRALRKVAVQASAVSFSDVSGLEVPDRQNLTTVSGTSTHRRVLQLHPSGERLAR